MKKYALILFVIFFALTMSLLSQEKIQAEKVLEKAEWKAVYDKYAVNNETIEVIKSKLKSKLRIDVYLAFWCGDSRANVPPFVKIIEKLKNCKIEVNYYIVKRKPNRETQYYVKDFKVERIPAFIFYREGKEIGRIIENPKADMLKDFSEIVL